MTTFATIPLDKITLHPDNVRRDAHADEEMVESIKSQGILQALSVVEAGDRYLLIAGHRRLDGATKAGLTAVPASILEHLTTRGQQIEAMLVENGQRVDLTPMEEAKAYEQLTFEGYKPKDIAKATGRKVATVQSRLKLNSLGDDAQAKIHARELSLDDAIKLTQLEARPDLLDQVLGHVGTPNFDYYLRQAFQRIERDVEWDKRRAELVEAGLTKIDRPESGWSTNGPCPMDWVHGRDLEPDAWFESEHQGPTPIISVVPPREGAAATAEAKEHRESDWERQRAEREEAASKALAATQLRMESVAAAVAKVKLPDTIDTLIRLALIDLIDDARDFLIDVAGFPVPEGVQRHTISLDEFATFIAALKPAQRTTLLFQGLAFAADEAAGRPHWVHSPAEANSYLAYLDWLEGTGHVFNEADDTIRAGLQERRTALESEDETA